MPGAPSSLQQLRADLQTGAVTPRVAVEQALSCANSNAGRNVYLALDAARALREAEDLPKRFSGSVKPPLYGLPVSLKDCFDLAGFVTTAGSRFYAERNPPAHLDSAVAARLRSQGAVILGKTHMHPLAYGITGENPDYGDCTQPGNAHLLTGGSSSGAAASVQEGSAVAAIGTDTGGSIRVPAALCGLAGYRASLDLAYQRGLWRGALHLAPSFDTLGWLFRDLRDAPLLGAALFALDVPVAAIAPAPAPANIRIGVVAPEFLHDCEPAVADAFTQWQHRLRELGARLIPIDSSFWEEAMSIYSPIQASEAAAIHIVTTGGDFSHFEPSIAKRLAWGASIPASDIQQFRQRHATFREKIDALLTTHDFLIAPCAPISRLFSPQAADPNPAPAAGSSWAADPAAVAALSPVGAGPVSRGRRVLPPTLRPQHSKLGQIAPTPSNLRGAILRHTAPMSLAGAPVVTLPAGAGVGIQLAASRGADARLLWYAAQLGATLET